MDPAKSRRQQERPSRTAQGQPSESKGKRNESGRRPRHNEQPPSNDDESTAAVPPRFFCPVCKRWRPYEIKRARKLLPRSLRTTDEPSDEVECQLCSRTFPLTALDYDPKAAKQEKNEARERFVEGMQRAMAAMVMIDGRLTFHEIEAMRSVVQQVTNQPCDNDRLDAALHKVRGRLDEVVEYLRESKELLSEKRRNKILRAVVYVAVASGTIDDSQVMLARRIGEALELGPRTVRQAIEEGEKNGRS